MARITGASKQRLNLQLCPVLAGRSSHKPLPVPSTAVLRALPDQLPKILIDLIIAFWDTCEEEVESRLIKAKLANQMIQEPNDPTT